MGIRRYAAESTTKSLVCPHCNAEHSDDWECLESDQLSQMRCSDCGQFFAFYIDQCPRCPEESLSLWENQPPPYWRAILVCQFCGEPHYEFIDKTNHSARIR